MSKKKAKKDNNKPSNKQNAAKFKEFLRSEGFAKLRGTAYILISIYLFLALLSYFCKGAPIDLHDNWMGVVGGWFASRLTAASFGFGAFGLLLILFLVGIRRLGKKTPLATTVWVTLFWMVWTATLFGYIAGHWMGENWQIESKLDPYAGSMGYFISRGLYKLISWFTFVILLFAAAAVLIFVHKVRFHFNKEKWQQRLAD